MAASNGSDHSRREMLKHATAGSAALAASGLAPPAEARDTQQPLPTAVLGCYDVGELKQAIGWTRNFEPLGEQEQQELLAVGRRMAEQWGEVHGPVA